MTISSTTVKNSYSGNGTLDTFNYTFKIFANTDLQVIIRDATSTETVKTLTTHYTVTGAGSASGGTIVFTAGNIPSATETVVIRRAVPQTQAIDYIANDPFPAESHEEGLDRAMMTLQQLQEEVDRSIKLSRTNTMNSTEFTIGDTERVNKVFGFDSAGELVVTQELGTFRGNWSTSTSYAVRDIIKDTSNGNIYICLTAHTSSGTQPISTNTDSAKWSLLVDAETATSSATAAAASAAAAASSATAAQTAQTAAELAETNAETAETNAETAETNAAASESAAATSASNASTSAANATSSATSASTSATTATTQAGIATTQATNASTSATNAATSETNAASSASAASTSASNASTSETNAASSASTATTQATNAATSATNAATSATAAQTAQTAAEAALDNFDDVYLGAKASDPALDNDGDALTAGDLYFNSTVNQLKYYDGSSWSGIGVNTDETVKVSANDTTNGYLNGKLIAGSGISFTENNDGGNETLTIASVSTNPTLSSISPDTITNAQTSITITGSNFASVPQVEFLNPSTGIWYVAETVTFNNSTSLTVQTTLTVDGTYKIRIENPDGLAVISSTNILTVSDAPTWTTAAGTLGTIAGDFSGTVATVVATSDSAVTYSEVTSPLVLTNAAQANCSLNSTTGVITTTDFGGASTTATTYNFTIRATDAEGQTADRSFSLTSLYGATGGGQFN
jgi:hypothetical protein